MVTAYTPYERFAYEEPWPIADQADDVPARMVEWFDSIGVSLPEVYEGLPLTTPIATEFLAEAASGGSCVVRIVASAVANQPTCSARRPRRRDRRRIHNSRGAVARAAGVGLEFQAEPIPLPAVP